ncbi:MAG TPA: hypothetical protein VIL00_14480 [Pseudonocardiaceae bacterium]
MNGYLLGPAVDPGQTVALVIVQAQNPGEPGGRGEDFGKSSPMGLLLLVLFFVAVGFLVRSMNKHLRRVPASFDTPAEKARPGEDPEEKGK